MRPKKVDDVPAVHPLEEKTEANVDEVLDSAKYCTPATPASVEAPHESVLKVETVKDGSAPMIGVEGGASSCVDEVGAEKPAVLFAASRARTR